MLKYTNRSKTKLENYLPLLVKGYGHDIAKVLLPPQNIKVLVLSKARKKNQQSIGMCTMAMVSSLGSNTYTFANTSYITETISELCKSSTSK